MTKTAALALLVATACTDDRDPIQVDGQYRVTIEQTANTCNSFALGSGAAGLTTRLDLFRRSDGTHDLHWVDGWVPADFAFSQVDLGEGSVRHDVGGEMEVVGDVTGDALDLELVHRSTRHDTGEPCERRAVVQGAKRPMFSPDSVDGRYIVTVEHRGATCANGEVIPPTGAWNMRMEVLPFRDDRASVQIEDPSGGMLRFWIEPIGQGGAIRLTRDLFISADDWGVTRLDGTVGGTIMPERVDLSAEIFGSDDPDACVTSYAISGRRWMPSTTSLDSEYRTTYRLTDTCNPSFDVAYEDIVIAIGQSDGRLDLIDHEVQSTLKLDGGTIAAIDSDDLTYRGTITPDHASYVVEGRYTSAGRACVVALEVDGEARYR
jgi:hypothetical protein